MAEASRLSRHFVSGPIVIAALAATPASTMQPVEDAVHAVGAPRQVSAAGHLAYEPDITRHRGRWTIAWQQGPIGNSKIYLSRSVREGWSAPAIVDPSGWSQNEPSISSVGGNLYIAWYETRGDRSRVIVGVLNKSSALPALTKRLVIECDARSPQMVASRPVVVAYIVGGCSGGVRLDSLTVSSGKLAARRRVLVATDVSDSWNLRPAGIGSHAVALLFDEIVYKRTHRLRAVITDGYKTKDRIILVDPGLDHQFPSAVSIGDRILAAWNSIDSTNISSLTLGLLRRDLKVETITYDAAPGQRGIQTKAVVLAQTTKGPVAAWCEVSPEGTKVIAGTVHMKPLRIEGRIVLSDRSPYACVPSVAANGNCLTVAWNEVPPDAGPNDFTRMTIASRRVCRNH